MVSKHKGTGKGKPQSSRSRSRSRPAKPRITLERTPLSARDKALKRLHLKPSDILSEATRAGYLVFVTKNGMKIRVKK